MRRITLSATILDMRTTALLLAALVLALPVAAQTAKPADAPAKAAEVSPKPPVITAEQRAAYFKAKSDFLDANNEVRAAQDREVIKQKLLQSSVQSMSDTCGKDFVLQGSTTGDPVCVLKPADKR